MLAFKVNNISLVTTKRGNLSIRVKSEDGTVKTLHSLYDPEAEAKAIVDAFQFNGEGILVILGLGLGYHVVKLLGRYPEANLVVVEAAPEIYELAKEHGRVSEIEDKVKILSGSRIDEVISEITAHQIKLGMPPLSVFALSSAVSAFPGYYKPIADRLNNITSIRLWDRLRYPKFKQETLKIALIDFNYFLNREVEKAITSLGHEGTKVRGNIKESAGDMLGRMTRMILDSKPDFILTINHFGFDEEGILTDFLKSIEMPAASWYVDSPNIIVKAFGKNASPYVSLFLWDKGYQKDTEELGFESVTYLPLATDETVFKPLRLNPADTKRYGADVGFVGNSMVEPAEEKREKIPSQLHPFIKRLARLLCTTPMTFGEALGAMSGDELKMIESLSVKERIDFEAAVLWKATLLYRLSCIGRLKEFRPHIHGDPGWKTLLGDSYRIGPPLHYYRELPLFYNTCKVNLNATSLQMGHAVNQRVFDIPACGAFLLTDHQESIEDLFEIDREVITYKDREEIPGLLRFYLNNPRLRREIAQRGRERVLKEHTYKHRLQNIIQIMKERYA